MKATNVMNTHEDKFVKNATATNSEWTAKDGWTAKDNMEMIELLNDEGVGVLYILDQETWVMDDGSYITRNDNEYWTGSDVDEFLLTEEITNEELN